MRLIPPSSSRQRLLYGLPLLLSLATWLFTSSWARAETAAALRAMADRYVARREFAKAVPAYRGAAAIYRRIGDPNGAKVLETLANRYETQLVMYVHRPTRPDAVRRHYTGARLEPVYGAYIGAFIDREDGISGAYLDENDQLHKDSAEFAQRIGRRHAVYFMYMSYGRRFPNRWAAHLRRNDAAAHIVLSPSGLNNVRDDGYLRGFARAVRLSGIPIFIRFAGEMNGAWVPYHGNPALYVEKFRLVARVFHEDAPNAAMVWCVNDIPEHEIARYYPGPDAVDWVGVNFYSVTFNDNDPRRPAEWRNPADSLQYVYRLYSARHPIMVGEYAATHLSKVDMRLRPDFAIAKIGQLYSALPRVYPRVKAIHWLSMNNLKYAMPGRQLNDYSLLEDASIAEQYGRMVGSRYFLDRVSLQEAAMAEEEIEPLRDGDVLSGRVTLSAYARSYEQNPAVVFYAAGKKVSISGIPGAHEWALDTTALMNGPALIRCAVIDSRGKIAAHREARVIIRNGAVSPRAGRVLGE
jgi:hypothetical protein